MPFLLPLSFVLAIFLTVSSAVAQQKYQFLGPNKCTNCHPDHEDEDLWWRKRDGPPPDGHIGALNQFDNKNTSKYAKALGYSPDDIYEPKNSCVRCHATVWGGEANAGVSCESCHGAGSGYVDVHQKKGAYQQSVALGMNDTIGKLNAWAKICMGCHVVDDPKLVKLLEAGHPSGDDFDLGQKFAPVVHWKAVYDKAAVSAAGKPLRDAAIARRGGPAKTQVASAAPSSPPPAGANPTPSQPASTPPPLAQKAPAAPTPAPAPAPSVPKQTGPAPKPPSPSVPLGGRGLPPSQAPTIPAPMTEGPGGAPLPPPTLPLMSPLPPSPAAAVAAIQGRAIALLEALLRSGTVIPRRIVPPENPRPYRGADAELLLLQQQAIELALEALSKPPPKGTEKE